MTFKIEISQSYDQSEPSNENELKSGISPWDIFNFDIIFHWSQNTKTFQ